ncbi:DUF7344 domain-containing protein [Halorarum salinum]|uniref:DUF7344 domain-containing protein n=1 Tax=Halorarum salinum TaxID=2743089 RepID=A0A7D5QCF3_9EURY|nr:hypothetical protein [Halobaculum salinum]QLG62620.1 hypothetical protein HUG12_13160 [Halobaculum salinum]
MSERNQPVDSGKLSDDGLFRILSHPRRRIAISLLSEFGPSVKLPVLAEEIAAFEHDGVRDGEFEDLRLRVYMTLYHNHVPRMQDAGLLEYHQERDLVVPADNLSRAVRLVKPVAEARN